MYKFIKIKQISVYTKIIKIKLIPN